MIGNELAKEDVIALTSDQHRVLEDHMLTNTSQSNTGRVLLALAAVAVLAVCLGLASRMLTKPQPTGGTDAPVVAVREQPVEEKQKVAVKLPLDEKPVKVEVAVVNVAKPKSGEGSRLALNIPKAIFVGTPKNIKTGNLIPFNQAKKYVSPVIMVPKGTENVAADKKITSSDSMPIIGELDLVTDSDKEGSDGSYVELGPGKQYVQIDLEDKHDIYALALWHYHRNARVYFDVIVQVSDDPDFLKSVTVFNNDHDNSSGMGVGKHKEYIETNNGILIDIGKVKGRYVRLYSNGSTASEMNHYVEVEVFGRPAKAPAAGEGVSKLETSKPRAIFCG